MRYFVVGLLGGGALSGIIVGSLGEVLSFSPRGPRLAVLIAILAPILLFELIGKPLRLPQNARAVPQTVINGPWVSAPLQFGFEMGTGVRTFMPSSLPHALVALVALTGGLAQGIAAGVGFAIARAIVPVARGLWPSRYDWDLVQRRALPLIARITAVAFAVAVGLVV